MRGVKRILRRLNGIINGGFNLFACILYLNHPGMSSSSRSQSTTRSRFLNVGNCILLEASPLSSLHIVSVRDQEAEMSPDPFGPRGKETKVHDRHGWHVWA